MANRGMPPLAIIKALNVLKNSSFGLGPRLDRIAFPSLISAIPILAFSKSEN